jgi:hypothetical protein
VRIPARIRRAASPGGALGIRRAPTLALIAAACIAAVAATALALSAARQSTSARADAPAAGTVAVTGAALTDIVLGAGRTRLRVRVTHTPLPPGAAAAAPARWFVRTPGTRTFRLVATTPARELVPGVLATSAIVTPPAARFGFRVCLAARWPLTATPQNPGHARCPRRDFTQPRVRGALEYEGEAHGIPLPAQPAASTISSAASYLDGRAGRTAFAVMDTHGHISGLRVHEHFESASVVKVMMLTAYLQRLAAHHLGLRPGDERLLFPMIHESNNEAASAVLRVVGGAAIARVAREAGMTDYAPGVGWWAFTQTSAIDQVRLFEMLGQLIPARFYGYARYLLSHIVPAHSWGIPPVARPRWQVFYKTGSLPSRGLFNEAARLERGAATIVIAVFTDGDPSTGYGEATVQGVAQRLLAGAG